VTFSSDLYRQTALDLVEKLRADAAGSSALFGEI
jgi:hypothetical protein